MIIVCPECNARYLLSGSSIGETGREVRCANCGHQWFQEPKRQEYDNTPSIFQETDEDFEAVTDIGDEDTDDDFEIPSIEDKEEPSLHQNEPEEEFEVKKPLPEEPIPDSVKPLPDGSNFPAFRPNEEDLPHNTRAKATAFIAAFVLFLGMVGYMAAFKDRVLTAWPASAGFYEMVGMSVPIMGEGLIIEKAKAVIVNKKGEDVLVVSGNILNLKRNSITVPIIKATLRDENGVNGEVFEIEPPVNIVEPAVSFPFTAEFPNVDGAAASVNLTFKMKI